MFKTNYSFRSAVGNPSDIIPILKEYGWTHAPIADISSTYGWVDWTEACKEQGLKPVYGVSLYVSPEPGAKKPVTDLWSFYAIDDIHAVNDLVTLATRQFRYNPLLSYEQAMAAKGVIKVAGHRARLDKMEPSENLYVGLSAACSLGYVQAAIDKGFSFIKWQDQRYPTKDDKQWFEIACGRDASVQTYPQWIMNDSEWESALDRFSVTYSKDTFLECNAELRQASMLIPEKEKTLEEMCREGAVKYCVDLADPVYIERLHTELKTIYDKKFEDYFYIVADLIQHTKEHQMVGPGRGSSAGSLVCYLLGITHVDPIKHGLLFFRFLDPNRTDWPDIDSDFADRDAAIDYLARKYGRDKVAKLGTVGNWQAKNTTNEVCKALSIQRYEADATLNTIPKYAQGDSRNDTALQDAIQKTDAGKALVSRHPGFAVAGKMSGQPSQSGVHAGGVILTEEPLSNFVALDARCKNGEYAYTTMCNLNDAEELNLLKLDVLGLKTLTVIDETLRLAGLTRNHLEFVPLDDEKAFDVLNDNRFFGVFQFEGYALRKLTQTMRVTTFDDLSILSALSRPGASVGAESWVRRRTNLEKIDYPHEVLKPYLEETLGTLVFQEQVMLIAHDVAGMDWGKVAKLRKAIGKSQGEEAMAEYAVPFIDGLVSKGVDQEVAEKFWKDILGFASYSFNKSHTVAYGLVSYWTCWLKAHHPLEFAAASLTQQKDTDNQLELLRELSREGIEYTPIDPDHSSDKWRVVGGRLVGPLTLIEGIGPKMVQQILSARARKEPISDRAQKLLHDPKTKLDKLWPIRDALKETDLENKPYAASVKSCAALKSDGEWQRDFFVAGLVTKMQVCDENEPKRVEGRISRGQVGRKEGQTKFIELRVSDDTETIYVKISCKDYEKRVEGLKKNIVVDKTLVVVSGTIPPEIPMMLNDKVWKLGELE